jgi:hypothetical protein
MSSAMVLTTYFGLSFGGKDNVVVSVINIKAIDTRPVRMKSSMMAN